MKGGTEHGRALQGLLREIQEIKTTIKTSNPADQEQVKLKMDEVEGNLSLVMESILDEEVAARTARDAAAAGAGAGVQSLSENKLKLVTSIGEFRGLINLIVGPELRESFDQLLANLTKFTEISDRDIQHTLHSNLE